MSLTESPKLYNIAFKRLYDGIFLIDILYIWLFIHVVYPSGSDFWCDATSSTVAAAVLLPLFSHFRVPYKSSGPGLMLSNEKRQGHTMLVDDVSFLATQT